MKVALVKEIRKFQISVERGRENLKKCSKSLFAFESRKNSEQLKKGNFEVMTMLRTALECTKMVNHFESQSFIGIFKDALPLYKVAGLAKIAQDVEDKDQILVDKLEKDANSLEKSLLLWQYRTSHWELEEARKTMDETFRTLKKDIRDKYTLSKTSRDLLLENLNSAKNPGIGKTLKKMFGGGQASVEECQAKFDIADESFNNLKDDYVQVQSLDLDRWSDSLYEPARVKGKIPPTSQWKVWYNKVNEKIGIAMNKLVSEIKSKEAREEINKMNEASIIYLEAISGIITLTFDEIYKKFLINEIYIPNS